MFSSSCQQNVNESVFFLSKHVIIEMQKVIIQRTQAEHEINSRKMFGFFFIVFSEQWVLSKQQMTLKHCLALFNLPFSIYRMLQNIENDMGSVLALNSVDR